MGYSTGGIYVENNTHIKGLLLPLNPTVEEIDDKNKGGV